ncbi:hypothetical protein LEMLEM_LOCUS27322 [Lemmus lemmus]
MGARRSICTTATSQAAEKPTPRRRI